MRKVSASALPSTTAMKQMAQTPHFKIAARIPESSLNTGLSVPTTTEPFPLVVSPDTQETFDMLEHDGKGVYATPLVINIQPIMEVCVMLTRFWLEASHAPHRSVPCEGRLVWMVS